MTELMLRLVGGGLLAAAGAMLGNEKHREMRRAQRTLEQLCAALGRAAAELTGLRTPMPQLFMKLEDCPFFLLLSAGFGGEPLEKLWRRAAEVQPIPERDRTALAGLGAVMGRYDAERQAAELELVRKQLSDSAKALEREISARGRHYAGLGAALGGMLAVVLF